MAQVLIPTDLSDNALNAAIYAVRLFGDKDVHFTLLHTYGPDQGPAGAWPPDSTLATESVKRLDGFAQKLLASLQGLNPAVVQRCEPGLLPQVVKTLGSEPSPPTLVVMGTQGASGLQEVLIGSNTADVIRHAGLPVLAVPAEARYGSPKRIMLAEDGGPVERATMKPLLDIARWSHSEVMIVRVVNEGSPVDDQGSSIYDVLLGAIPHTHHYLSGDNVQASLSNMADQNDTDLLALIHRRRGVFERLFHRSTSARMVMHTHVPMLVLQQARG